jgi:hypothetical protein
MNNIPHTTINTIITDIYRAGLKEQFFKYKDGQILYGYYLQPKYQDNINYEKLVNLPQLERIFINVKSKAKKIYGKTNTSDFENQWSEALLYLYSALESVFSGSANVDPDLIVNTVDDIYNIITNEKLASKLCRYCITFVDMKFKTFMKQKGNPDYFYNTDSSYYSIDYLYLDDDSNDGISPYEELEKQDKAIYETGEVTQYIMDNYFALLTPKQQLFMKCYIWFGQDPQGHISTEDGTILYIKQEYQNYRKAIAKKLIQLMKDSNDSILYINQYDRLDLNWKGIND